MEFMFHRLGTFTLNEPLFFSVTIRNKQVPLEGDIPVVGNIFHYYLFQKDNKYCYLLASVHKKY